MKIVGIITEYNPLHKGHEYQIKKTREITGADYVIAVMSGNFVQRGLPAILDKYKRTQMALSCGVDLVLELPVCYAVSSAPYFATGGVSLLERLGVVDAISFGSESGDLHQLQKYADCLENESSYQPLLKQKLKSGLSYPAAFQAALEESGIDHANLSPNDILAVSYLRALAKAKTSIQPITVKRIGASYNEEELHESFSCATAIRKALFNLLDINRPTASIGTGLQDILTQLPEGSAPLLKEALDRHALLPPNSLSPFLHYQLLQEPSRNYTGYLDVNRELSDRIRNRLNDYTDFTSFCELLKTKELTYSRICRSLLHIFLTIRSEDMESYLNNGTVFYARPLGFRKDALPLLKEIRSHSAIPFISKLADYDHGNKSGELSAIGQKQLSQDIHAAHLYHMLYYHTTGHKLPPEGCRPIIRI